MTMVRTVDDLAGLVGSRTDRYLRWSAGPAAEGDGRSRDALTAVGLPGLSVNALAVEPWWGARAVAWVGESVTEEARGIIEGLSDNWRSLPRPES